MNENLRKQLVVIVIQAKDEEEACVRSAMVHRKTKMKLSVSPLSTLGIYWAAAGDVLIKKPKQS